MDTYKITGGEKISGEIEIQGSKNSALPIIASSILINGTAVIKNVPNIRDVLIMQDILRKLGCKVKYEKNVLTVNSKNCDQEEISSELMKEMRSSIVLMGAILTRQGKVVLSYPGGCEIGSRPIDLHLEGLRKLGAMVYEKHGYIVCESKKLIGTEINLDFPSVGATENIILAATLAEGTTIIRNAAREPEIIELQTFLNKGGANIHGAGTSNIVITGVKGLTDVNYEVKADRIVAGTYLCGAAMTKGELLLKNVVIENVLPIIHKLQKAGCLVEDDGINQIYLKAPNKLKAVNTIKTMPYPGFPTDMQSQIVTLLSIAEGTSVVVENIFENRYKYVSELTKMGAEITIEGKIAIINGVSKLTGATVEAKELRGGASLVLAGLTAEGYTSVSGVKYIERGYENFVETLNMLGAKILKE